MRQQIDAHVLHAETIQAMDKGAEAQGRVGWSCMSAAQSMGNHFAGSERGLSQLTGCKICI